MLADQFEESWSRSVDSATIGQTCQAVWNCRKQIWTCFAISPRQAQGTYSTSSTSRYFLFHFSLYCGLYLNFDEGASSARLEPSDQLQQQQQQQQQLREPLLEDNQVPRPHDSPRSLLFPDLRTAGDWQLAFALANVAERNEEIVKLERRPALRPTATLHRAQYLHAWTHACFGSGPVCAAALLTVSTPPLRTRRAAGRPQDARRDIRVGDDERKGERVRNDGRGRVRMA